jgi:ABC-2 type transport system ATP-binding protein
LEEEVENAITVEDLRKNFVVMQGRGLFKRERREITAVGGLDFVVPSGQALALIGPNGAGKSTTIKMLCGILQPDQGRLRVLGLDPSRQRAKLCLRLGAVFGQRSQLWYHLPPRDSFELLARVYNLARPAFLARQNELIERFALADFLDTPVRKLSLGQRMRAEVAASLLHRPAVLFLDEPTIGLDVIARQELREVLRQWNSQDGLTILLTSHDAGDIEQVAKRVLIVNHGRIVLDDQVEDLRRRYFETKILEVRFAAAPTKITLAGVETISQGSLTLKLAVNTQITSIESVMQAVLRAGSVVDIAIEDPPLEEVIAHIYQSQANQNQTNQAGAIA